MNFPSFTQTDLNLLVIVEQGEEELISFHNKIDFPLLVLAQTRPKALTSMEGVKVYCIVIKASERKIPFYEPQGSHSRQGSFYRKSSEIAEMCFEFLQPECNSTRP